MRGIRVRRPLPWSSLFVLAVLALLLPFSGGCQVPGGSSGVGSGSDSSSTSEGERTHAMEEKAADLERRAEEIRNMEGSEQEKIDAVNRLEQERRELGEMQDGGSTP